MDVRKVVRHAHSSTCAEPGERGLLTGCDELVGTGWGVPRATKEVREVRRVTLPLSELADPANEGTMCRLEEDIWRKVLRCEGAALVTDVACGDLRTRHKWRSC